MVKINIVFFNKFSKSRNHPLYAHYTKANTQLSKHQCNSSDGAIVIFCWNPLLFRLRSAFKTICLHTILRANIQSFFYATKFLHKKKHFTFLSYSTICPKTQKLLYSSYERTILCKHQNAKQTLILKPAKNDYYLYKYQKKKMENLKILHRK